MQILPPSCVHGVGDQSMARHFARTRQLAGEGLGPAGAIRCNAAAHQQTRAAAGTRREIRRQLGEVARAILEPGVHRAHDDAIGRGA